MSALTRVLREDTKRSLELITNIIFIFFCFSTFSDFHSLITANKLGDMCLKIIDQEKMRWSLWKDDFEKSMSGKGSSQDLDINQAKFKSRLKRQDQLLFCKFQSSINNSDI